MSNEDTSEAGDDTITDDDNEDDDEELMPLNEALENKLFDIDDDVELINFD